MNVLRGLVGWGIQVDSFHPLRDVAPDFPGNGFRPLGHILGGDGFIPLLAEQHGDITTGDLWHCGNIDDDLIHRHAPENGASLAMNKDVAAV